MPSVKMLPHAQILELMDMVDSGKYMASAQMLNEMEVKLKNTPSLGEQEGLGEAAMVHMHYELNGSHWLILEIDPLHNLAFGYHGELGYISIEELVKKGGRFDYTWSPKTLKKAKEKLNI